MKSLKKWPNIYLFSLLSLIIFISIGYLNSYTTKSDILSDNFSFFTKSGDSPVGNVYPIQYDGTRFIPEKIYIFKNDVIQFTNTQNLSFTLTGFDKDQDYVLTKNDDFFRKFSGTNDYTISVANVSNSTKLYIKVK